MNKALMISMKPEHAVNILNGNKTLELRSWIPKGYVGWVYVYCTKNKVLEKSFLGYRVLPVNAYYRHGIGRSLSGSVLARFWFDEYDTLTYEDFWDRHDYIANAGEVGWEVDSEYIKLFCLDYQDILDYGFREKPHRHQVDLYAWYIKDLEIFDEPKRLSEFYKKVEFLWADTGYMNVGGEPIEYHNLTKAPQRSVWVYTKEKKNEQ